jgi:DNA-binding transcriptional LysR family regulator
MTSIQITELTAFVAVAEQRSFTKAAAQVGIALPTMSQTIRSLEERLGVRLFNRTTRSVALTEAGERLLAEISPLLQGLSHAIESVNLFRDKPIGTLRLAVWRPATMKRLAPMIKPFLAEYPGIRLEVAVDDTNSDIVSGRYDAGIRIGQRIERDMTVLRLADDFEILTVAAPEYLARHPIPSFPKDLREHNCIRFRSPWDNTIQPWVFSKGRHRTEIAVDGSLIVNDLDLLLTAALDGVGVARIPEPLVAPHLAQGSLSELLDGWSTKLAGVYLYYPSRRQQPMPLRVFLQFVDKWRKRSAAGSHSGRAG